MYSQRVNRYKNTSGGGAAALLLKRCRGGQACKAAADGMMLTRPRRAELAPQNKLKIKTIEKLSHFVFHSYNEKVRQLKVCAPPWPPKKNTLFVTNFQCGKAIFLGGQGGAKRMCKIASCNSQMSGTYIQKPYPHFKKMHAKR